MTDTEVETIISLIQKTNDIETLERLKLAINARIMKTVGLESSEELKEKLTMDLSEFIRENFEGNQRGKYGLLSGIRQLKGIKEGEKIKVFHVLGINRFDLEKCNGCGELTINRLNKSLKQYGLSINTRLSESQIKELENLSKQNRL